jgi:hypothetical protein
MISGNPTISGEISMLLLSRDVCMNNKLFSLNTLHPDKDKTVLIKMERIDISCHLEKSLSKTMKNKKISTVRIDPHEINKGIMCFEILYFDPIAYNSTPINKINGPIQKGKGNNKDGIKSSKTSHTVENGLFCVSFIGFLMAAITEQTSASKIQ